MEKHFQRLLLAGGLLVATLSSAFAAVPVNVAPVIQAEQLSGHQIPGRIEAIHSVEVRARTEGTIVNTHFREGQYVNKGDLLFELDDAQPKAALALAQAELQSAQASLRQAQQLLSRYQRLQNNHSISRNDVDNAQMQRDVAAAAVAQAKAREQAQKIVLGYTRITSAIDGRVGHSQYHTGSLVNAASGVLVDVVQLDPVRIAFSLDEQAFYSKSGAHSDIAALKSAWLAQISPDGQPVDGILTSVDNRIDPRTASVTLRAEFANPGHRLLPGGSVNVWLQPRQQQQALLIPAAAVHQDSQGFYSWVIGSNAQAQMRRLTLAGQQGQQFIVTKGVQPEEQVVTEGAQQLRNGVAVQLLK